MKIRQIKDSRNQHIVAIERDGELYCWFANASMHIVDVAFAALRRDLARHGEEVVDLAALRRITRRTARSGRIVYDV